MSRGVYIVDLANQIFLDLMDDSINITRISNWLRGQVGTLNSLINEDYFIDQNDEMIHSNGCQPHQNPCYVPPDPSIWPQPIQSGNCIANFTHIHNDEAAILKKMFMVFYYDWKFRKILNSLSENLVLSVKSDGQEILLVNRNSIAQSYLQMKKVEVDELKKLINGYVRNRSNPRAVNGDDTIGDWGSNESLDSSLGRFYSW